MTASGSGTNRGARQRALAVTAIVLLATAAAAQARDSGPASGRGFVWGAGLNGGRLGFPGAGGKTVVAGDFTGELVYSYGADPIALRTGQVQDAGAASVNAQQVAAFPSSEASGGFSMHAGYAFSRRVALLLEVELAAGLRSEGFNNVMGGVVLRYRPAARVWLEAGPASGDLRYGYEDTVVADFAGTGHGFMAAAGFSVLRRPKWTLDLQSRYGKLWYDGFQVTSLSFGLSASRLPL